MRAVSMAVVVVAVCLLTGCATEWSGWYPLGAEPVYEQEVYGPEPVYAPEKEVGFRQDGVVVWREREKE